MSLSAGLYRSQDQQEDDLTNGPGWTIDEQKPSFLSGLATAIPRGIGQGAAAGISMLTHGIREDVIPAMEQANPFAQLLRGSEPIVGKLPGGETALKVPAALGEAETSTRNVAADLVGDPRTTGTAANVVQGFSKAATEFTLGTLAGGPEVGATFLGATDGYAHYADLLDQGVDHDTAAKSGMLTAITSGGAAMLPMGMPAKWLAGLSRPVALLAQAGAGSAINTGFGVANRYAGAEILRNAGYDAMADQQEVWDKTNLLTDAISGAFFGAHAGWHGIKQLEGAHIDPSVLDAAKVVQDRQAVVDAAPGIPVDPKSAAIHREALTTADEQLLSGKPVDLSDIDTAGAAFARGDVDESAATKIIRDAFVDSGAFDDMAEFDRWIAGQKEPEPIQAPKPATAVDQHPDFDTVNRMAREAQEEGGKVVDEQTPKVGPGVGGKAEGRFTKLPAPEPVFYHGTNAEFDRFKEEGQTEGEGLFHFSPNKDLADQYAQEFSKALGGEPRTVAAHLDIKNPLVIDAKGKAITDDAVGKNEAVLLAKKNGNDGVIIKNVLDPPNINEKSLATAKPTEVHIPFNDKQIRQISPGPLADRPDLRIADETGEMKSAAAELARAVDEEAQANKEAGPMHEAAVACEARYA